MNKNAFQLVFNAARGCIMVVSEATQRSGKNTGSPAAQNVGGACGAGGASGFACSALRTLTLALTSLSAALVQAQIIADPTAPGNQRPTVLGTPGGAPLVNIQTPSAAGVSRNTYQQFDVGTPGAVLNNSRTSVQTQLGGWVQGNPWLATGEARIILNEVNSQNPSYLNGFIEVAGRRAEVIIANPAGIQVNGGGFINASRATLTTGTPIMNGGNLEGYRVQRGTIRIDGKGLNASLTDYTGILARAIELNAQVHAQQLDVVTGVNQVEAASGEVQSSTTSSNSGSSPSFALDVSLLGGMYAAHIRLVGTEAGVGVRHHGTMAASVGDVQVDANGWLSSAGRIEARQGHVRIQTTGTQNHSGVLLAAGNLTLHSGTSADRQALTHSGQSRAGLAAHIRAGDMRNTGQLDAQRLDLAVASLNNRGEIWQTGAQALHVQAGQLSNEAGAALGRVVAANSANTPSPDTSTPNTPTAPSGSEAGGGTTPANPSKPTQPDQPAPTQLADGQMKVAEQLQQQDGAVLASEGDMHLSSLKALSNAGDVRVDTLQAKGERFENTAGTVWARNVSIDTQVFEQAQGAQLYGQSSLSLQSDTLSNAGLIQSGADAQLEVAQELNNSGTLAAANDVVLEANDINNTDGQIVAGRDLQVQAANTLNNTRGVLSAQRQLVVRDAAAALQPHEVQARQLQVVNSQGRIVANSTIDAASSAVDIQAKSLNLDDGTLHSGGDMAIDLVGSLHTPSGQNVRAGGDLRVQLHGNDARDSTFSNAGQWQAGQNLTVRADHIVNHASGELSSQATTSLSTLQNASGSFTNRGLVDGMDTRAQTHTLINTGTARVFGDRVAVAAHTLTNREETASGVTKAGTIAARERLDIGAQHITNREGALLFSAGYMAVGGALDTDLRAKTDGSDNAKTFNNNSATVESLGDMALATNVLRNTNDHLTWSIEADETTQHREDFSSTLYRTYTQTTQKGVVDESAPGQIVAAGNMELTVQDQGLNQDSLILAGGTISGDVGALENLSTQVSAPTLRSGTTYDWGTVGDDCNFLGFKCDPEYGWRSNPYSETIARQVALPTTRFEQQANPSGSGRTVGARGDVGSVASAGAANPSNPNAGLGQQAAPTIVLPNSSLFTIDPASNARYLVETDPRFTNYRHWLSSDYLLTSSGFKPEDVQKRLGDGFYEQKLIREQVAALTGHRFLGDYRSDEAQYQALMAAGATFAQAHQLRPGIVLSAAQVAQLTSDIVWLVTRNVQLPDGSTTTALVPQVYLSPRSEDLAANGYLYGGPNANLASLISARNIQLALSGDLNNSGTIAGRQLVDLSAQNIANRGLIQGDVALLHAKQDIDVIGGQVLAHMGMSIDAGNNFTLASITTQGQGASGSGVFASQHIDRVAGLYVSGPAGVLLAGAGNNITLAAAHVHNAGTGTTQLQAGGDFNLATVQTGISSDVTYDTRNYARVQTSQEVGSQITGGGTVSIQAQNDIQARAAQVSAQGALNINAAGNVIIESGQSSQDIATGSHTSGRGLLGSSSTTTRSSSQSTTAQASELGGQTVAITSGADIRIVGSNVLGDEDLTINAGGDLNIEAAHNTASSSSFTQTRRSGMFSSGGLGVTIGSQQQSTDAQNQRTTAAASTVGAIGGNVNLNASQTYTQRGSDVLAPGGDINIGAQRVTIEEARETSQQSAEQRARQSGLTVAITSPVISAVQTINQQVEAAGNTQSGRMQALAAANVAFNAQQAANAVQAGQAKEGGNAADQVGGVGISISLGSSRSQSNQSSSAETARGSNVSAGGDVNITASGAGKDSGYNSDYNSDITIQGSTVQAGGTTRLSAEDEVRLLAAANTRTESNSQSSRSGSIGVTAQLGAGGAQMGVTASASRGAGQGAGSGTTYTHTQVGGQSVQMESGGDTTLKGAVVSANQVSANVGGNLHIETLQDQSQYRDRSRSAGGSVTIGPASGGSLNLGQTRINSTYQSATEQSGIRAADGGFQVQVDGQTTLVGGAITSTQAAIDNQHNAFTTAGQSAQEALASGALTLTDLNNHANYSANSVSVGLGAGAAQPGQSASAALSGVGIGRDSGSASSTTLAAISGLAGNTQARTGDASTGIGPIFDADKVRREVSAQVQITQEFNRQAGQAIDQYVEAQRTALREQAKNASTPEERAQAEQAIKDVNMQERALNILVGALTGMGGTMITKEALSTAAEKMRDLMIEDSRTFAGVVDSTGQSLDNISSDSVGVRGDGIKLGGTRVDLDGLCGPSNERCAKNSDGSLALNQKQEIQFIAKDEAGNPMTIDNFLKTPDGKKLIGATGGVQGMVGTMFGIPYAAGSWMDRLVEAFAGPHDYIGGGISGLYDEQGNAKRGMSELESKAYDSWSVVAIPVAAPFAAADGISREVWQAIHILLRAAR